MALSVVFCGTPDFAVPSLEALARDPGFRVALVVTQPDRPAGRGKSLAAPSVKRAAERLGIPVFQPERLNACADAPEIAAVRPFDLLVVVAYGQILSSEILGLPGIAPVNLHASLLPRWRGASPIQHALLAGDAETGVTVQRMVPALDAGPILGQRRVTIGPRETARTLHDRLAAEGAALLPEILSQPLRPVEQDPARVTLCSKLRREDGTADPTAMTAEEIDRRVRALTPWPGVTVTIDGDPLKLLHTELAPGPETVPLPCAQGTTLWLAEVQPPNKPAMAAAAWERGRRK